MLFLLEKNLSLLLVRFDFDFKSILIEKSVLVGLLCNFLEEFKEVWNNKFLEGDWFMEVISYNPGDLVIFVILREDVGFLGVVIKLEDIWINLIILGI